MEEITRTYSEDETIEAGFNFAKKIKPGDIVLLYGDLGAGKTEFIKGICNFFQVDEIITSPTFTIMNQYFGSAGSEELTIYHLDLYRIKNKKELEEIGFAECLFDTGSIKLIEWAERSYDSYPAGSWVIKIGLVAESENERTISISMN